MNSFQIALDRYLTTPPDDGFDQYFELVTEAFSEPFYQANEDWIMDSDQVVCLVDNLIGKDTEPERAAKIIERWYNLNERRNEN